MRKTVLVTALIFVIVLAVGVFSFGHFFGKLRLEFRNASLYSEIEFVKSYASSLYGSLDNDIVPASVIVKLNTEFRRGSIIYAFIVNNRGQIIHGSTGAGHELARPFTRGLKIDEVSVHTTRGIIKVLDIRSRIDDEHSLQIGFPMPEKSIDIPSSILKSMLVLFLPGMLIIIVLAAISVMLLHRANSMKRELRKKDRLAYLGEISGGLAHELKNPLNTVKMNIQLIQEDDSLMSQESLKRKIGRIDRELDHLTNYLMNFLRFARTRAMKITRFDVAQTVSQVVKFFAPECTSAGITIRSDIQEGQIHIRADEKQLKQLLLNLLLNAKQASQRGSSLFVRLSAKGDTATLEIEDEGSGIPKDNIEKIFTPFFTTKKGGTGIGMSVVRRIVEDHAGKIAIQSTIGKGTRITITLPRSI